MYIFRIKEHQNSRFKEHDFLCDKLEGICKKWGRELDHYLIRTEELFGLPELPWLKNERVIVGSLAHSIARNNRESILAEELPIKKATKSNFGQCDLWAHIPSKNGEAFNFYLEAKKFLKPKDPNKLQKILLSSNGINRMFNDYVKSVGKINKRSSQQSGRKHKHYVIGMICIPLNNCVEKKNIKEIFDNVFSKKILLDNTVKGDEVTTTKRLMTTFPTVGFYYEFKKEDQISSMFVTFTILGCS